MKMRPGEICPGEQIYTHARFVKPPAAIPGAPRQTGDNGNDTNTAKACRTNA